jgi:ribose 5-phosphate isomerase B
MSGSGMNKSLRIAIGSDHAGFELKQSLKAYLLEKGYAVNDFGTFSEERADYPDFAHKVAIAVETKEADLGILLCGSGNGINMTANKHQGIRSALCWTREIAKLARQHNDANILALPARFIDTTEAMACLDIFLNTPFEGGRHADRISKIPLEC